MKSSPWKAGVATATITPAEPMWLAGWAARREPASGKSMDLFVKALALQDAAGRRAVILTADLIAIPRELASRVQSRLGLARECILFNASHTHCGPEVRPDKVPFFEIPPEFAAKIPHYLLNLEEKMAAVIEAALKNLEPVVLQASQTSAGFAHNRRTPAGPVAHDVPVLQILRPDKKPLAILFGYACHNLTLPPSFCHYHGDYAGVAQQILEETFPGATALFLAGAGADQDPDPRGTVELTAEHGRTLARVVAQTLTQPARSIEGPLRVAFAEVLLDFLPPPAPQVLEADIQSNDPPRVRKAKYLLDAQAAHRTFPSAYPCPVQVLRFGNELLLIALGGEPVVDYAVRLKKEFAGPLVWVAGYSNDMFGYLPSRRVQAEGGYEGGRALLWSALPGPFTDTVEDRILAGIMDIATPNR
jgi:neutral ceramidase